MAQQRRRHRRHRRRLRRATPHHQLLGRILSPGGIFSQGSDRAGVNGARIVVGIIMGVRFGAGGSGGGI